MIKLDFLNDSPNTTYFINLDFLTQKDEIVFGTGGEFQILKESTLYCNVPESLLNDISYKINFYLLDEQMNVIEEINELLSFEIKDIKRESAYLGKVNGLVRPRLIWE
jgi:lipopolysaccharide transport system ATP-binding protein